MSSDVRGETQANPETVRQSRTLVRLVAVTGPSAGRALAVVRATATVGRHPTNDFEIADPRVSALHLELSPCEGGIRVRDVGSMNGTWLGPYKISDAEVSVG